MGISMIGKPRHENTVDLPCAECAREPETAYAPEGEDTQMRGRRMR